MNYRMLMGLVTVCLFLSTTAEAAVEILPDYHLTQKWVKAGAYFKNGDKRVKVQSVHIKVFLPVGKDKDGNYLFKTREHRENNVGEPDWSGWWHEPWEQGFFYYTVKAKYKRETVTTTYVVGRNSFLQAVEDLKDLAEVIAKAVAAGEE